jgi:hypothetical protein
MKGRAGDKTILFGGSRMKSPGESGVVTEGRRKPAVVAARRYAAVSLGEGIAV